MKNYSKACVYEKIFSHVYVERDAFAYPLTQHVLSRLRNATVVSISHYKDIFNRPGQHFDKQKNSQKLILAIRRGSFLYPGAKPCDRYGHDRFFYATQMMNCLYDCEYCYLRGLYDSANMVAFVNTEDYFKALEKEDNAYISISYDTDLLAMEPLFGFVRQWLHFIQRKPNLTLEVRTKSATFVPNLPPLPNVIFAWTLSHAAYEKGAPSFDARLQAMRDTIAVGWKVRLCIDPVIAVPGWETDLKDLLTLAGDMGLYDISIGGFRCSAAQFKKMAKMRPGSVIAALPLIEQDGVVKYTSDIEEKILQIKGAWT